MDLSVLMVTPYFPPMINGPSLHVYQLVRGLIDQGIRVHVHTMSYGTYEDIMNFDDGDLSITNFKHFSFFRGASFDQPISISYVKSTIETSDRFDVVHVHDFPKLCNDTLILALKRFKPRKLIVLTPHGAGAPSPTYKISSKLYWSLGIPLKVLRSADNLITVTPLQKKVFSRVCDEQKISMISEAVPPHYFVNEPSFLEDDKLKILFIGRIIQEKGVKDLLYAVNSISKMLNNQVELRCIGPDYGFMQEALKIIKDLNLENTVNMLGLLSEDQKIQNLNWCDVLVLPSYYEAFGIPIVEAMAHAKPVIATKTIGAMSLIRHNETGFLVNFGNPKGIADRLMQFLNNPKLKFQMGKKALKSVFPFSMQNMTRNHIDLYQNLMVAN